MIRGSATRASVFAWLLCAVLSCLACGSISHCDQCDGPYPTIAVLAPHPLAHPSLPVAPDRCNGLCSCCRWQGLSHTGFVLASTRIVSAAFAPEPPSPPPAPRALFFRPPRIAVSV